MQQPLVSCIMPTYNRRKFIPHAIRYFLRQDYEHKQLIIVDDGTDKIEELVPGSTSIRYDICGINNLFYYDLRNHLNRRKFGKDFLTHVSKAKLF
ncbi:MAG: glycosyltransferase [Ferruginibacter sp.]